MNKFYLIESYQSPNFEVDILAPLLTDAEYKLFDITVRKTFGDIAKIQDRRATIPYTEYKRLSGQCDSTIAKALGALVQYKILLPTRNARDPRGQEYLLNLATSFKKDHKKGFTHMHCSCRLMDLEGLKQRKAAQEVKNRQKTANARAAKTEKTDSQSPDYSSVKQSSSFSVEQRSNYSVEQSSSFSVEQSSYSSVKQSIINSDLETQKENPPHPHYTPLDLATGEQQKVCVSDSEQQTIFEYLERKLQADQRVQQQPPIQPYPDIFAEVMTLRQINAWELQQLILGILSDGRIKNPIGALRSPDKFKTDYYIKLEPAAPEPVAGLQQGDVWQQTLAVLQQKFDPPSYNTWLRPTRLLEIADQTVKISVPDEVYIYWLGEHYQHVITDVLTTQLGYQPKLDFVVAQNPP